MSEKQVIAITHHMTVEWENSPTAASGKGAVIAFSVDTDTFETAYLVLPVGAHRPAWVGDKYLTHARVAGH